MSNYDIYCDGGCRGNGKANNIGAFAVVVVKDEKIICRASNGKRKTTNNEMELQGILVSVKMAKKLLDNKSASKIRVFCDSAYSINTVTDWMWKWAANGWTKKGGLIKNLELIKSIYDELNFYSNAQRIEFIKVKGHNGDIFNEEADKILNDFMDSNF